MNKLYVVVRGDLSPGAQTAQACHAVSAYAVAFPEDHRDWHKQGQNLVVLQSPDRHKLGELCSVIEGGHEIATSPFYEPDLNGELTAFAVSDLAAKLLSQLPLAGRKLRCDKHRRAINGTGCSDCRVSVAKKIDAEDCRDCA